MPTAVLLLGADRGDPSATFAKARILIGERIGPLLAVGRDHWTEPWGFNGDRPFLNCALLVEVGAIEPAELLARILDIEKALGRVRTDGHRYGPRTIDIDILFMEERVVRLADLEVPHPRVHERAFALAPAADIVPGLVHPVRGRTVLELLNEVLHDA